MTLAARLLPSRPRRRPPAGARGAFGALALLVLATGCASDPQGPPPEDRRASGRAEVRLPNVFISPAGEPFRAPRGAPYPSAVWFAGADADHDGRLTKAEFLADAERFFKVLDANSDGVVDGFELQHYERDLAPEINPQIEGLRFGEGMDLSLGRDDEDNRRPQLGRGPQMSGKTQAGDRRPEGAGIYGLLNEPEPVAACDLAFDSKITLQEFLEVNGRRFDALDKGRVGYLTLAALPKTPVQAALERRVPRRPGR